MKISYVELAGTNHPVCFSLSAIEDIEDEFGSLEGMKTALTSGKVKAINRVLEIILRAGRAYCDGIGEDCPPPLRCRPGDLIGARDTEIITEILRAMRDDSDRAVEVKPGKN